MQPRPIDRDHDLPAVAALLGRTRASGGLSHKFWSLREIRNHETAAIENITSPEAAASDQVLIARLEAGDHAAVLADYPAMRRFSPEGMFAHYLMMVGALGGPDCTTPGVRYSDYESAAGTGQVHIWFDTLANAAVTA